MSDIERWNPDQGGDHHDDQYYGDDRRYFPEPQAQQPQVIIIDRDRRHGIMPDFIRHHGGALMVGALVLGGVAYVAYKAPECLKAVSQISDKSVSEACLTFGNPNSEASFSQLTIVKEEVTGDTKINVYGQVSALVGSDKPSEFKYEGGFLDEWPGIPDGVMRWNPDNKTEQVDYNVCLVGNQSDKVMLDAPKGSKEGEQSRQAGITYTIETDPLGNPTKLKIKAGYLDVCFPRIAVTPENAAMWTGVEGTKFNIDPHFDGGVENTFRYMQERLIMAYVPAAACPDKLVNMDALKESIATEVIGSIYRKKKISRAVLDKISDEHLYEVTLGTPAERQAAYKKAYEDTRNEISNMKRSNPDHNGDTHPLEKPKFADLVVKECAANATTPITVKAQN